MECADVEYVLCQHKDCTFAFENIKRFVGGLPWKMPQFFLSCGSFPRVFFSFQS